MQGVLQGAEQSRSQGALTAIDKVATLDARALTFFNYVLFWCEYE